MSGRQKAEPPAVTEEPQNPPGAERTEQADEQVEDGTDSADYEIVSLLSIGDSNPVQGSDGQLITAEKLWGQVVTALRARGPQNLYAIASQADEVYLSAGTLYVKVREDDYESANSYKTIIGDTLNIVEPGMKLMIIKRENTEQAVFIKEVARIRRMLGQAELRLRK